MAASGKRPSPASPPSRKKTPLPLILGLGAVLAAGAVIFFHHGAPAPTPAADAPPTAAVQPEVKTPQALPKNHIYSETADPHKDIADALKQAQREHKRVLLDFGGDWCGDCQVLDLYLHQPPNAAMLAESFVVVHIFIDQKMDNNLDLPTKYDIPIHKGVPALAVLDAGGKVLYSQKTGEFENMRNMDAASVTDFLNRWKA